MIKSLIGFIGSAGLTFIGIILRWNADGIGSYETKATAIAQVGIALMSVGILLLVVTYIHWLFANESKK